MVERQGLTRRRNGVDYCLSDGDGSATMWTAPLNTDVDGNGTLDAVGLDVDGDGGIDDALADLDGDGVADHAVLDGQSYFTDDGSGTWAVSVDRGGQLRWFARRHLDGDGQADDRLVDVDGRLADRALGAGLPTSTPTATDAGTSGSTDSNADGKADIANDL